MKLTINEQMKHRVVGVFVIVAIASIFLPALMKKSNYRFDDHVNVAIRLPKHPSPPKVNIPDERKMFSTVKVAQVKISPLPKAPLLQTVKAEPLNQAGNATTQVVQVDSIIRPAAIKLASLKPMRSAETLGSMTKKNIPASVKNGVFAVQLATFSQQKNAEILVNKLKEKGFKASYHKFAGKQGNLFKVLVGEVAQKEEAVDLQKQLAESMRLKGFIVKKEVS
ncbi:Sporulation domain-containing protein [Legionella adelaidensis]|uniref:Sporulation domain-containing protein n=2 Tax=Legionella adelaidensis TaxID=45056 RepID=A0A0W0R476_9GAMM|nr:SPOR domain-containing protein [Legionella adelaidensis]KTC65869.1 Sporulation domain-containing protein [Legionella adelaidensis]